MAAKRKSVKKSSRKSTAAKPASRAKKKTTPSRKRTATKPAAKRKKSGPKKASAPLAKRVRGAVRTAQRELAELGTAGGHALSRVRDAVVNAAETVRESVAG